MKSPFSGMDPYLEEYWRDIHVSLIVYARDQLASLLPPGLVARAELRVLFEGDDEMVAHRYPDFQVVERPPLKTSAGSGATAIADSIETETYVLEIDSEPFTERFIEIIDATSGHRLVTVIEFLSPTNKWPGEGLSQYKKKQKEYREGKVSLVEIDLLRQGRRDLVFPMHLFKPRMRTTFNACVRRGWKPGAVEVYPIHLYQPLPKIKVPLRERDVEIALDLQPLVDLAYRNGGYADTIDYRQPCEPPLEGEEAKWADELLKAAGKR